MLIPATTTDRLEDYGQLNDFYAEIVGQWARELGHVAVVVGGVYRHEKYPDQVGVIHTPVPRARQAEAVGFLNENAFATPTFLFDPDVLRRIEPTGHVERVRQRQTALLNTLFQDSRLARLAEQQATLPAGEAYALADLFGDVRRGLFSEYAPGAPVVDPYRRNIQNAFVDVMDRLLNSPLAPLGGGGFFGGDAPTPRPRDAQAMARLELTELAGVLRPAQNRVTDRATRAHVGHLLARIDEVLNPGD
jgi:hypothetical protein